MTKQDTLPPLDGVSELVKDIHDAIAELAGVSRYPDLTEAIDRLAALAAQAPQQAQGVACPDCLGEGVQGEPGDGIVGDVTWRCDSCGGSGKAAPQAAPAPAPQALPISALEEQQMFDDWCPYKGSPDPRVVWAAAIDAANGLFSGLTERKAPQALTDEQIEAGAKMLGKLWKWDELEAVYKDKYRARFVEAIEAARAASAGGEG